MLIPVSAQRRRGFFCLLRTKKILLSVVWAQGSNNSFFKGMHHLFLSFSAVAVAAEHLAVLYHSASTLSPRRDMVAFHELQVKFSAAESAFMPLLFPLCHFYVFRKSP